MCAFFSEFSTATDAKILNAQSHLIDSYKRSTSIYIIYRLWTTKKQIHIYVCAYI